MKKPFAFFRNGPSMRYGTKPFFAWLAHAKARAYTEWFGDPARDFSDLANINCIPAYEFSFHPAVRAGNLCVNNSRRGRGAVSGPRRA